VSTIELSTSIDARLETVFDMARSIDAHVASMQSSGEGAVAGIRSGHIELGESVTWRARHFGITFQMTSRIVEMETPHRFVDEQVSGPFKSWRHLHSFQSEDRGTRMFDRIDYTVPLAAAGRLFDRLFLERYLTGLVSRRNDYIARTAESS